MLPWSSFKAMPSSRVCCPQAHCFERVHGAFSYLKHPKRRIFALCMRRIISLQNCPLPTQTATRKTDPIEACETRANGGANGEHKSRTLYCDKSRRGADECIMPAPLSKRGGCARAGANPPGTPRGQNPCDRGRPPRAGRALAHRGAPVDFPRCVARCAPHSPSKRLLHRARRRWRRQSHR